MKNILFIGSFCLCGLASMAQLPEDVLKFGWYGPTGTARTQAIGGAIGALGGDLTASYVNPAGLAFYKTKDVIVSPGYSFFKNNINFRGTNNNGQNSSFFNLGTSGAVFGSSDPRSAWNGKAFSIAVSTVANFNSHISYTGQNNFSSYGEQYAADAASAASNGLSFDDMLNDSDPSIRVSAGTKLGIYTYLIDTLTVPGLPASENPQIVSMAMWKNLKNGAPFLVTQQNSIRTNGGITEIALGFAATHTDRFYLGGSLGIPIVSYERNSVFTETDASGDPNNNFEHSTLTEKYSTRGVGVNIKLGAIYKPVDQLRVGLALHSPSFYGLKDSYYASMTTNTENYVLPNNSTVTATTDQTLNLAPTYKYDLSSPWRFIASAAYVIHETEDVKQQRGFITADIEYVTYKSNSYKTTGGDDNNSYYKDVNKAIKDYYKNAFNFRLGGEIKFNTIMARLGFSYYSNPYKESELKGKKMFVSGGLGYRNKGLFLDLTYVHSITNDVDFPYRLPDKANTFATVNGIGGNIAVTAGIKF
ncbi:MAG: hypothetical protein ABI813_09660 [Bacteroidota bacterium]